VDEAAELFAARSAIHHALRLPGLGSRVLTRPAEPTLSGGEAAADQARDRAGQASSALFRPAGPGARRALPPPTPSMSSTSRRSGSTCADVRSCIAVLHRLVSAGTPSVLVRAQP